MHEISPSRVDQVCVLVNSICSEDKNMRIVKFLICGLLVPVPAEAEHSWGILPFSMNIVCAHMLAAIPIYEKYNEICAPRQLNPFVGGSVQWCGFFLGEERTMEVLKDSLEWFDHRMERDGALATCEAVDQTMPHVFK
jgi:hypothetical protein